MAIVGYEYRKRLHGETDWESVVNLGAQLDLSEVIAELASGTEYDFQVRGYDPEGVRTDWSNIATAATFGLTVNAAHLCCTGACGLNVHAIASGDVTIDTVTVRPNGTHSIRLESLGDSTVASWQPNNLDTSGLLNDGYAVRLYINFEDLPSASSLFLWAINNPFISPTKIGIAYHQPSGTFRLASLDGIILTFASSGSGVISSGQWYQIDIRWYVESGSIHCEAEVEEAAIASHSVSPSNLQLVQPRVTSDDSVLTASTIFRIADFILSTAKDDYPIGPGHIRRYVPFTDGNHRIDSTGDFKVGTTGTDIADSDTTSNDLVDDSPMPESGGTVAGDDFIRQAAAVGGSGTQYVEHNFGSPDSYVPAVAPRLVQYLNTRHADGALGSGNGSCRLVDNTTEEIMSDFTDVGSSYQTTYEALPVNIATEGPWRITGTDGNFLLLKHRFGHSTGSGSDIALDAVMIEAEFPGSGE